MMTTPTIHLNGTSRDRLEAAYDAAYRALTDALIALAATAPNARDYYVQGPGAYERAADQHDARCRAVAAVRTDMLQLHDSCSPGAQQLQAARRDEEAQR